MINYIKLTFITAVALFTFSCSSSHHIYINKDNSADIKFNIKNKPSLTETLTEWGVVQDSESPLNVKEIESEMNQNPEIVDIDIKSINNRDYIGSFRVKDLNMLFTQEEIPNELKVFNLIENGEDKALKMNLSLENYIYLKSTLPILQEDSIDMVGPEASQDYTQEEYLDMLSFTLGDKGPEDLMESNISLIIEVDGNITEVTGGEILSNTTAEFKIPLIRVIMLKEPLEYSVTYR